MRATLLAVLIIAALSLAGCPAESGGPKPGTGPGDNKNRTTNAGDNLGGEPATVEDWRNAAASLLAAQGICGLFRAGNDTALTTTQTHIEVTRYAATANVPAALVNTVGEYYRGALTPDTADNAAALAIRRGRVVAECDQLHL
jgi:hypothetical protein